MPDVDGGIVRLIIDQQHRLIYALGTSPGAVFREPLDQVLQRTAVLLDHEHGRFGEVLEGYSNTGGRHLVEVPVGVGEGDRASRVVESANPHKHVGLFAKQPCAIPAHEALVDPPLRLASKVVMNARDDHD